RDSEQEMILQQGKDTSGESFLGVRAGGTGRENGVGMEIAPLLEEEHQHVMGHQLHIWLRINVGGGDVIPWSVFGTHYWTKEWEEEKKVRALRAKLSNHLHEFLYLHRSQVQLDPTQTGGTQETDRHLMELGLLQEPGEGSQVHLRALELKLSRQLEPSTLGMNTQSRLINSTAKQDSSKGLKGLFDRPRNRPIKPYAMSKTQSLESELTSIETKLTPLSTPPTHGMNFPTPTTTILSILPPATANQT